MRGGRKNYLFLANIGIHALDMALVVIRRRVRMKHRCELRFRSHLAFTYASLSRVPLCISWAFLARSYCFRCK